MSARGYRCSIVQHSSFPLHQTHNPQRFSTFTGCSPCMPYRSGRDLPAGRKGQHVAGRLLHPATACVNPHLAPSPRHASRQSPVLLLPQEKHKAIQAPYGRPCLFANALSVSLDYLIGSDKALFIDDDEVINLLKNYNDLPESEKDTVKNVLKALNVYSKVKETV